MAWVVEDVEAFCLQFSVERSYEAKRQVVVDVFLQYIKLLVLSVVQKGVVEGTCSTINFICIHYISLRMNQLRDLDTLHL